MLRLTAIAVVTCRSAGAVPASPPNATALASPPSPAVPASPPRATVPASPPRATVPGGAVPPAAPAARLAAGAAAPATWQPLPALAAATAGAAGGTGITVDTAEAWGDPAMGCYAVWLALRGAAPDAAGLADQVIAGLTGLAPTEIVRPSAADGVLGFTFARPPYRGQARVRLATGRVTAVACFANAREPVACAAACTGVLEHVP